MKKIITTIIAICLITQLNSQCLEERHNTNITDAWVSCQANWNPNNTSGNSHWILYNFDETKTLYESIIWNINHPDYLSYGAKRIRIDHSLNKINWTYWGEISLAQATARSDYIGESGPDLNGLATKHLLITVLESYGNLDCAGFSEIKIVTDDSSCPNEIVLDLNDDIFGVGNYQASSQIIVNNTIHSNADVTLVATDRIQFLPGFTLELGAELKADIGGCGD